MCTLISVIIPAYNAERTILGTIKSVQKQTFSDFEIIVINDGSTDRTLELVLSVEEPRLKIFSYQNGGVSVARNRGISHATGEFIAFLDADDLWTSDKLELQLAGLKQHPEAGIAYSWTYNMSEKEQLLHPVEPRFTGNVYADLLLWNFISNGSNPLIRRQAIEFVGEFCPLAAPAEDWDYWLRLSVSSLFVVVPKHQVFYRHSSISSSSKIDVMKEKALGVLEKAYNSAPPELQYLKNQSFSNIHQYYAEVYLRDINNNTGDVNQVIQNLWKAVRLYPQTLLSRYTKILVIKTLLIRLLSPKIVSMLLQFISTIRKTRKLQLQESEGSKSATSFPLITMTSYLQNSNSTLESMPQTLEPNDAVTQEPSLVNPQPQPTIALLPCCDLFEDFFDTIGMSLETYCKELTGGWQFNYIESLQQVGVRTVIFFFSARVSETTRFVHIPTGATICVLPPSRVYKAYRAIRRQAGNIWKRLKGKSTEVNATGSIQVNSAQSTRSSWLGALKDGVMSLGSYLSTPLGLLMRELRREGCDAILCQDYEYARFDVCVLLGKFMHLPVFATFQGGDTLPSPFEYPLRWLSLRASSGLIIASQIERQRVQAFYGVSPTKLVPIFNPLDVTTFRSTDRDEARSTLGISREARVVAYHGRIQIWQKGLDILLEAWEQICRERPGKDLRLLLVGTGSDADELHRRIAAIQLKGVVWIDEYIRDRSTIQQYLSAADVYTLPSRKEGFPVAPIEAMACNLPIVAADVAGISDILEKGEASGGLVVPYEDAKALALALGRVIDDEVWGRELGKRARCRTEECFSFEVIGKQLRDTLLTQKKSNSDSSV